MPWNPKHEVALAPKTRDTAPTPIDCKFLKNRRLNRRSREGMANQPQRGAIIQRFAIRSIDRGAGDLRLAVRRASQLPMPAAMLRVARASGRPLDTLRPESRNGTSLQSPLHADYCD